MLTVQPAWDRLIDGLWKEMRFRGLIFNHVMLFLSDRILVTQNQSWRTFCYKHNKACGSPHLSRPFPREWYRSPEGRQWRAVSKNGDSDIWLCQFLSRLPFLLQVWIWASYPTSLLHVGHMWNKDNDSVHLIDFLCVSNWPSHVETLSQGTVCDKFHHTRFWL